MIVVFVSTMIVSYVKLNNKIKSLVKQNALEHQKLNKNQAVLANELSKLLNVLRQIDDGIVKTKSLVNQRTKTLVEQENVLKTLRAELDAEQIKTKKANDVIKGLMRKLNELQQQNNYNSLTNK